MNTQSDEKTFCVSNIPDLIIEKYVDEILEYLPLCSLEYQDYLVNRLISKVNPLVLQKLFGDGWYSATYLSMKLGISKQKFGKIVTKLNLRTNKFLTKSFIIKVSESKYSKIFFYHEDIQKIIKDYLNKYESTIS